MHGSKGRKGDEPPRAQVVDTKLQRLRLQSAERRAAMAGAGLAVAPEPRGETAASGGAAASAAHWCPPPPPSPRTEWTRRVPHPVLSGHAASLTPY
jgi:hypothetical protein